MGIQWWNVCEAAWARWEEPSLTCLPCSWAVSARVGAGEQPLRQHAVPLRTCAVGVSLPPHREVEETLAGVSSLLVSLGHSGRIVFGHTLNMQTRKKEAGDPSS